MLYVCYMLCFAMAYCIINIYCKMTFRKTAKEVLSKRKLFLYVLLLGTFICWGGDKPDTPDPPVPPDPPEEPEEPDDPEYEPVEGIRIKLIGKHVDGKFIPITSEWIQTDATNIVDAIEQASEELE